MGKLKKIILIFLIFCFFSFSFASEIKELIQTKVEHLGFSDEVNTFLISMLPIFELRGAIPIGINFYGLNPILVFFISVFGNMVPIAFILLFFIYA